MGTRRLGILARAAMMLPGVFALAGCSGTASQNPFQLVNLPAGEIKRTHAKPPLWGFYNDFDPAAQNLKVEHVGPDVNQVRTQHVLIATVCDKDGNGRRNRRVEWHVSGVGHIVEVDESGVHNGRGHLVDDKYAVSYTNFKPHTITRGNDNPADDFELKPGQTWCTITSAEEGETHVTVYAPGINDWDKHKQFVIKHWVDADAILPPSAVNPVGTAHDLVTMVRRKSDASAAMGYRVRYQILDGPPAVLEAPGAPPGPIIDIPVDAEGRGFARLKQLSPQIGRNRVKIDVVRPPTSATGRILILATGEMHKDWVAPNLVIAKNGPNLVHLDDQITYTIRVANSGTVPTSEVTVRDTLPPGLQLIGTNPITTPQGANLFWKTKPLNPGEAVDMQVVAKAIAPGQITNVAQAVADNLPEVSAACITRVVAGKLLVTKQADRQRMNVGETVRFVVKVQNVGDGPATNITIRDDFDPGFRTPTGAPLVLTPISRIDPGQGLEFNVDLVATTSGKLCNSVQVRAENLREPAGAQACVEVDQPTLIVEKIAKKTSVFVGGDVEYSIIIANRGTAPAPQLIVEDAIPPQLRVKGMSPQGKLLPGSNKLVWELPTLAPGEATKVDVLAEAVAPGERICNRAFARSGSTVAQSNEACIDIRGVPALNVDVLPSHNPIKLGQESTFVIRVLNPGTTLLEDVMVAFQGIAQLSITGSISPGDKPGRGAGAGQIVFDPVVIPPGRAALFEVRVRGERPGKGRIKVSAGSPRSFTRPYEQEQSITVYDPNGEPTRLEQVKANPGGGGLQLSAPSAAPASGSKAAEAENVPAATPDKMTYSPAPASGAADARPTLTLTLPASKPAAAGETKLAPPTFNVSDSGPAPTTNSAVVRPTSAKPAIVPDLPKE